MVGRATDHEGRPERDCRRSNERQRPSALQVQVRRLTSTARPHIWIAQRTSRQLLRPLGVSG